MTKRVTHRVDEADIKENVGLDNITQYEFCTRFNDLISENEIDQKILSMELDIATGTISKYRNGKSEPKATYLKRIADYFNVSTDYLLGNNEAKDLNIEDIKMSKALGLSTTSINNLKFLQNYNLNNQFPTNEVIKVLDNILSKDDFINILGNIVTYKKDVSNYNGAIKSSNVPEENQNREEAKNVVMEQIKKEADKDKQSILFEIQYAFTKMIEEIAEGDHNGK